jgi:hypothetical protein
LENWQDLITWDEAEYSTQQEQFDIFCFDRLTPNPYGRVGEAVAVRCGAGFIGDLDDKRNDVTGVGSALIPNSKEHNLGTFSSPC